MIKQASKWSILLLLLLTHTLHADQVAIDPNIGGGLPIIDPNANNCNTGNGNTPPANCNNNGSGSFPTFPTFPSQGNGSGLFPIFPGFPGNGGITINYSCPLVDQDSSADLLASLDTIEKAITETPACKSESTAGDLLQKHKDMKTAAEEIKKIWENPDGLWSDSKKAEDHLDTINVLNNQISTLMNGMQSISDSLNNNELINSSCGREMLSKKRVLHAVSDLVSQVSPFAVFAASASGTMSTTGPYLAGVVGIANVIKTLSRRNSPSAFNNEEYDQRQTLMKATCEYMRIYNQIKNVQNAQTARIANDKNKEGDISSQLNTEINQLNLQIEQSKKDYNTKVVGQNELLDAALSKNDDFLSKSREIRNILEGRLEVSKDLSNALSGVTSTVGTNIDGKCTVGIDLLEQKNEKPYSLDEVFKLIDELYANMVRPRKKPYALGRLITEFQTNLKNFETYGNNPDATISPWGGSSPCGDAVVQFSDSFKKVLAAIEVELNKSEELVSSIFKKNPRYSAWYKHYNALISQRDSRKKLLKILEEAPEQRISKAALSELVQRLDKLRNTLFGTNSNENFIAEKIENNLGINMDDYKDQSPLGAWLEYTLDLHGHEISMFNNAMHGLLKEVSEMRRKAESRSQRTPLINEWESAARKTELNLSFITTNIFPLNGKKFDTLESYLETVDESQQSDLREKYSILCDKIGSVWNHWMASQYHYDAMKNLCTVVTPYINENTGHRVLRMCGLRSLSSKERKSTINEIQQALDRKGFTHRADQVLGLMKELKCYLR